MKVWILSEQWDQEEFQNLSGTSARPENRLLGAFFSYAAANNEREKLCGNGCPFDQTEPDYVVEELEVRM